MKLLIIDDDTIFLNCIKQELVKNGDDIKISASPVKALEYFKNEGFDIVITDLNMPVMSGIDLMAIFHKINNRAIIVIMSSSDDEGTVKKALDNGAYGFLNKQSILTELPEIYKKLTEGRDNLSMGGSFGIQGNSDCG